MPGLVLGVALVLVAPVGAWNEGRTPSKQSQTSVAVPALMPVPLEAASGAKRHEDLLRRAALVTEKQGFPLELLLRTPGSALRMPSKERWADGTPSTAVWSGARALDPGSSGTREGIVAVAGGRAVTIDSDLDHGIDGTIDQHHRYRTEYDSSGRLVREMAEQDLDNDGVPEEVWEVTHGYDSWGNLLLQVSEQSDGLGSLLARITRTLEYDERGANVLDGIVWDEGGDGTIEHHASITTEYDTSGNPTRVVQVLDWFGMRSTYTLLHEYDDRGNRVRTVEEEDSNSDGSVNRRSVQTIAYDARDNPVEYALDEDRQADGLVDYRLRTTSVYDPYGNLLQSTLDIFDRWHQRLTLFREVDRAGNELRSVYEDDFQADRVIDSRFVIDSTRSERGLLLLEVTTYDTDADGTADTIHRHAFSYDRRGRQVMRVQEFDQDADGTIDFRELESRVLDARGDLVRSRYEGDYGADGILETQVTRVLLRDRLGTLLRDTEEWITNGVDDFRRVSTYQYEDIL